MNSKIIKALIFGLIFGILDVVLMLPMSLPNKSIALAGAFFGRFAIGFLIPLTHISPNRIINGLIVGLLISLPDAVISGAFIPIIGIGLVGGVVLGFVDQKTD